MNQISLGRTLLVDRLRTAILLGVLLFLPTTTRADSDDSKWCRTCHDAPLFSQESFEGTAHADLTCTDCHLGYQHDPHEPVEVEEDPPEGFHPGDPAPLAGCLECHDGPAEGGVHFAHGIFEAGKENTPHCLNCHGNPHSIPMLSELGVVERRRGIVQGCQNCHGSTEVVPEAERSTEVIETYEHSIHARKLTLGSEKAPGCTDCHGGHEPTPYKTDRVAICAKCHEGATANFAALPAHEPFTPEKRPVGYYTKKLFATLTFITIFLLSCHVLLHLFTSFRNVVWRREDERDPTAPDAHLSDHDLENKSIQRFDRHQRIQHGMMASSFILLVLTGWPLSANLIAGSAVVTNLFGGMAGCALIHRIAAVVMVLSVVYHFLYVAWLFARGELTGSMIPGPKDFVDVFHQLLYFFGIRKEKPRFPRYSYFEKFDYWAVFWGVAIMVGSGIIRWYPVIALKVLPTWAYEIAYHAHADEALLAGLAIFVWHFYNVHLRPTIFPMSWVFLTGRLSLAEFKADHREEYDTMMKGLAESSGSGPAAPSTEGDPAPDGAAPADGPGEKGDP